MVVVGDSSDIALLGLEVFLVSVAATCIELSCGSVRNSAEHLLVPCISFHSFYVIIILWFS